jgi:transcription antitermination factor NusG
LTAVTKALHVSALARRALRPAWPWDAGTMPWLVAQTKFACEDNAHFNLVCNKFKCYLPRYRNVRGKISFLFPRYIFIYWPQRWQDLFSVRGISRVLMDGDLPGKVGDEIVDGFRGMQIKGVIQLPRRSERFKRNQRIMATRGSFESQIGLYLGMTAQERELVLFEILGRKVPVEFSNPDILIGL